MVLSASSWTPVKLRDHDKSIVAVKYDSTGVNIASASADRKVHIHSSVTGELRTTLNRNGDGHMMGLNDCCWLTESLVATASDDSSVKLWDIATGQILNTFKAPKGTFIYSLCADAVTKLIYAGSFDGQVCCLSASSADPVATFHAHGDAVVSLQLSPSTATSISNSSNINISGSSSSGGGGSSSNNISNSNSSDRYSNSSIDSGYSNCLMTAGQESLVRIWDARRVGFCLQTVVVTDMVDGARTPLSCASYSPNGKFLLTSTLDSTHRLIELPAHKTTATTAVPAVSLSPSINRTAATTTASSAVEVQSKVHKYTGHVNKRHWIQSRILHNYQGTAVISGSEDGNIPIWDVSCQTPSSATIVNAHTDAVVALDCHPCVDIAQFVSGSVDGTLTLWNNVGIGSF